MKTMFDIIKKQNGERFAKAIRSYDNGIFDIPGLDKIVKFAGNDAEVLMNYLISLKNIKIEEHGVHQHPFDLLSKAGYNAYYADTLEKQNWPKQFYAKGEELCTFRDPDRYKKYHIIVAIKKNVQDIKRENFTHPMREDEYGTSVLQIQILKSGGFISIKNRYNHTVENPDNTFNSNPDNIIPGLSEAIKHHYHVDFSSQKVYLPEHYVFMDKKIIKCNYELNNVYFGENCYAQNGKVYELDKNSELMLDYFVLNLKDRTITNPSRERDAFVEALQEEIKDKKLQIIVNQQGNKCLQADGHTIVELEHGKIKAVNLDSVKNIGNNFLSWNTSLKEISLSQAADIGNNFLYDNKGMDKILLPQVTKIGNDFLRNNETLTEIDLPKVQNIGDWFLGNNHVLNKISLPQAKTIGACFLGYNEHLNEIILPEVTTIGYGFLYWNNILNNIDLPKVAHIGDCFCCHNEGLKSIFLPEVTNIGTSFLLSNKKLDKLLLPEIRQIGDYFLRDNNILDKIDLPKVNKIGICFLNNNEVLREIDLPTVQYIGSHFLFSNNNLTHISLPNVTTIKELFLPNNDSLEKIYAPNLNEVGVCFLDSHPEKENILKNKDKPITDDKLSLNILLQQQADKSR